MRWVYLFTALTDVVAVVVLFVGQITAIVLMFLGLIWFWDVVMGRF